MEILKVLPLKLYKFKAPKDKLTSAIQLAKDEKYYKRGDEVGTHNYGYSSTDCKLHKRPEWHDLHKWIEECLEEVRQDQRFRCDKLSVCLSWTNKSEYGEWHHPHTHGLSLISGILYLTGDFGNTWFSLTNPYFSYVFNTHTPDDQELIHINKQDPGDLILFPSSLKHSVDQNIGDERTTLAFNAFPTGGVGETKNLSYADIILN